MLTLKFTLVVLASMASHGGGGGLFAEAFASFARRSWTRFAARASARYPSCGLVLGVLLGVMI